MGGEGNFRAAGIFFRYQIPCMNFFQALAWIFLRVNWRARIFFHLIFPCANFFFVLRPPPSPHKFSNGPSLIQIHQFTIKIDKINISLLFECVKIVEFNFNSHVFHVMYQETRFLNQDACFLNQEGRRQLLISFVSERDWNRKMCQST